MWSAIALACLLLWLLGTFALKAVGAIIHLLIVLAMFALAVHLLRRAA